MPGGGGNDPAPLPRNPRPGRPARRAGPLPVRVPLGEGQAGRVGADGAGGGGLAGDGGRDSGPGLLAFWSREHLTVLSPPVLPDTPALGPAAERVLERLRGRGASFVTELAQDTGLPPSNVRTALWDLLRRRLVTNDHFDVIRK